MGGFLPVLNLSALVMALAFPVLYLMRGRRPTSEQAQAARVRLADAAQSLRDLRIVLLLVLSLAIWTTFTTVFFFLQGFGNQLGIANPGWFLTLSTGAEMAVRVVAGRAFDKGNKPLMLAGSMFLLGVGYIALAHSCRADLFFLTGVWLGLGWGVAMPLLSGLVFDISAPRFRALNSNLNMVMFQAGFFVGPLVGAAILSRWGYTVLYDVCACVLLITVPATIGLGKAR
jgi:predicted MFS family arabinose efflux permease